jgi:hypothetical protein
MGVDAGNYTTSLLVAARRTVPQAIEKCVESDTSRGATSEAGVPSLADRLSQAQFDEQTGLPRVITGNIRAARRFLRELKEELKRDLDQEEILIVEKEAELL